MEITTRIQSYINNLKLLKPGETVLVAVSGGADSIALLHILNHLKHHLNVSLHAVHFNHQIRKEAFQDEKFVEGLAGKLNIPFSVGRRFSKKIITSKISEDESRKLRYAYFFKLAKKLNVSTIALAHTQDDLAETVLMRIIRGTGLLGLQGISPARSMASIQLVHPLLEVTKKDLLKYLQSQRLFFREDQSNASCEFFRNKIRLKLLPLLSKEYNPSIVGELAQLSKIVSCDYDFLLGFAQSSFAKVAKVNSRKSEICIAKRRFQTYHLSIQRLILRISFQMLRGNLNLLESKHIIGLENAINNFIKPRVLHLPDGMTVHLTDKNIIFKVSQS